MEIDQVMLVKGIGIVAIVVGFFLTNLVIFWRRRKRWQKILRR